MNTVVLKKVALIKEAVIQMRAFIVSKSSIIRERWIQLITRHKRYYIMAKNGLRDAIAIGIVWVLVNSPDIFRYLLAKLTE